MHFFKLQFHILQYFFIKQNVLKNHKTKITKDENINKLKLIY